jgi:hypothetical protein
MVSVFQENRVRIHVKFVFAWKTVRLFPTQTKRKHNKIIPSVIAQKWKTVWFFVFCINRQKIPWIQGIFCLFMQNTKNQTGFLFQIQTDGIILLCFPFVCVGNSLHVFQANTNFTCILTLFSWNTETIPSSEIYSGLPCSLLQTQYATRDVYYKRLLWVVEPDTLRATKLLEDVRWCTAIARAFILSASRSPISHNENKNWLRTWFLATTLRC